MGQVLPPDRQPLSEAADIAEMAERWKNQSEDHSERIPAAAPEAAAY
jgi:hypothetical protein